MLPNYLLRLGWGYKDKEFSHYRACLFNLNGVGKSPLNLTKKLTHLNSYISKTNSCKTKRK